jgi:hypothetical protein
VDVVVLHVDHDGDGSVGIDRDVEVDHTGEIPRERTKTYRRIEALAPNSPLLREFRRASALEDDVEEFALAAARCSEKVDGEMSSAVATSPRVSIQRGDRRSVRPDVGTPEPT